MAYHVSILKRVQGRMVPIGADEVSRVVEGRGDLRLERDASGRVQISDRKLGEAAPILVLQRGEIWINNPDRATLELMIDLAGELGARVRGDELETYRTPEETYCHPDDLPEENAAELEAARLARRTRWRIWALWLAVVGTIFLMGRAVDLCSRR